MINPIKSDILKRLAAMGVAAAFTAAAWLAAGSFASSIPTSGTELAEDFSTTDKSTLLMLVDEYADAATVNTSDDFKSYRSKYTVPSVENFESVYAEAAQVAADENAPQWQIDLAADKLAISHAYLTVRSDISELEPLYQKALEVSAPENAAKYSASSLHYVTRLIDEAGQAIEDSLAPQYRVDNISKRLAYAIDHLVVSPIAPETAVEGYRFTVGLPEGLTESPISKELSEKLNNHINRVGMAVGCIAYDLESGFTVGFNHMGSFFAASTVKASDVLFIYNKLIDHGSVRLTDVNRYMPQHHNIGAGSMQFSPYGTKYTLEQASTMAIRQSDNAAYYMLLDIYGIDGFNEYMKEIGCTVAGNLTKYSRYDNSCAYDAALVWKEIYTYTRFGKHGTFFRNNLINAVAPVIGQSPLFDSVPLAHKSGWSVDYYNDIALAYAEHPYMIAFYSRRQICSPMYLIELGEILGEIINEYQAEYYG